jgi:hypothetical protein
VWTEVKTVNKERESLVEWRETELRLKELCLWSCRSGWTWQAAVAAAGLGGGILAAATGSFLSAVAWARGGAGGGLSLHGMGAYSCS